MTDSAGVQASRRLSAVGAAPRVIAFALASRHTARVRFLRRFMLFGALGLSAGISVFVFFNPFRALVPGNLSIEDAGLSGSRVTMAHPKMSGFRSDGRPYDFVAKAAVQDLRAPNVLELIELDAHVTMPDKTVAHITANAGSYDSSRDTMDLKGDIHLLGGSGYDVRMSVARIDFKAGNVRSEAPVSVVMQTGSVQSDTMALADNGKQITFDGHVHSVMLPASDAAKAVSEMKGTTP